MGNKCQILMKDVLLIGSILHFRPTPPDLVLRFLSSLTYSITSQGRDIASVSEASPSFTGKRTRGLEIASVAFAPSQYRNLCDRIYANGYLGAVLTLDGPLKDPDKTVAVFEALVNTIHIPIPIALEFCTILYLYNSVLYQVPSTRSLITDPSQSPLVAPESGQVNSFPLTESCCAYHNTNMSLLDRFEPSITLKRSSVILSRFNILGLAGTAKMR